MSSWATGGSFWDGVRQGLITSALNHAISHGWSDFSKSDLEKYANKSGKCNPCTHQELGSLFEDIFENFMLTTYPMQTKAANFRKGSLLTGGNRNTKPDFIADDLYNGSPVSGGSLYELKAKNGGVYLSSQKKQLRGHIDNQALKKLNRPGYNPTVTLITTSDIKFSIGNKAYAYLQGVNYYHRSAQYRISNGKYIFRFR